MKDIMNCNILQVNAVFCSYASMSHTIRLWMVRPYVIHMLTRFDFLSGMYFLSPHFIVSFD